MSKYLVLIYEAEQPPTTDRNPEYDLHWTFMERNRGVILGGEALQQTTTATCLRKGDDGTFAVTDGPFTETKEALGGFYLLEAPDLDAAIELAKQIPAPYGGVEIRPIMEFN
jgi:hypothetical protein